MLRTGLIAGTLDITDNLIFNEFRGITPTMVFHYIASGLFGIDKALQWGTTSVVVGVAVHYTIALIWTAIFYEGARSSVILTNRLVISGLLYGVVVYLVMNLIVLPLSGLPRATSAMTLASRIQGVLAVMFCIGLTISLR